jgi:hypothetical protein
VRDHLALAEDAAALIAYGLQPRLRPAQDPGYAELLARYRVEQPLRELVAVIVRGLQLSVLGETALGLVLGAEEGGPFAMTLADYRRSGMTVADRMSHGLVQLAIAAYCFPTAHSLDDPDQIAGTKLSVQRVVHYLVDLAKRLEADRRDAPDAASDSLGEAWRVVLARAETRATPDGRRAAGTLEGMVAYALERLEHGGLMRKVSDAEGSTWQALGAYRLQVRELAAHDTFLMVRRAGLREQE